MLKLLHAGESLPAFRFIYVCLRHPSPKQPSLRPEMEAANKLSKRYGAFFTVYVKWPWKIWKYTIANDDIEYARPMWMFQCRGFRERRMKVTADEKARVLGARK